MRCCCTAGCTRRRPARATRTGQSTATSAVAPSWTPPYPSPGIEPRQCRRRASGKLSLHHSPARQARCYTAPRAQPHHRRGLPRTKQVFAMCKVIGSGVDIGCAWVERSSKGNS
eukprot:4705720-Prymnesium_polylepis.2